MKLPVEVAEHYDLVGWKGGPIQVFGKFGVVNINTLTLRKAEKLVAKGFTKLAPKEIPTQPAEPEAVMAEETEPAKPGRKKKVQDQEE